MAICSLTCINDDHVFLEASLASVGQIPKLVAVSETDWTGNPGSWQQSVEIAKRCGAEVITGRWSSESEHRAAAIEFALAQGFSHAIILDSDEVIEPKLLDYLVRVAETDLADRVYIAWDTYWKDVEHVIRPREQFTPCILINLLVAKHERLRDFTGGRPLFLPDTYGIVHHLSYCGGDARIWRKVTTWGHRDEVVPDWWERSWKGWDVNFLLRDLHPTHPPAYGFAERIPCPEILSSLSPRVEPKAMPYAGPKCSIVIPTFGGQDDIDYCLASLENCRDLIEEIIVVDDASPEPIRVPEQITLIRREANGGFAETCNAGYEASTAPIVIFLNSDTVVPRTGLVQLLDALNSSGSIAAAGPYTNYSGHSQQVPATYTSIDHLDLFADSFAERHLPDVDVDMLVGFCLAVKLSVLTEIGVFDTRFGRGTFEDNDLSYRIRRAGYRLVIAARSFVHHSGSQSLTAANIDVDDLLRRNHRIYLDKWREDLESGFANTLSGLGPERIAFNPSQRPESRLSRVADIALRADMSLCMIVRNEERTIRDCLESVRPFVREMLVLDTGSTDRTIEICEDCGATVRQIEWPDSFALARTESMRNANGKWIFWVDADDTLPIASGEAIVNAVAGAPEDILGFVIPVQFLEEQGHGTVVDHVKVFRNWHELEWEGRIHEQILGPLRAASERRGINGRIVRLDARVLHSGYDTSPEGQARKHERDTKLLSLDLKDRPDHPFVLFNLGMTAHYSSEHEKAVDWLRQSAAVSADAESHLRKAYALMGASLRNLELIDEAEAAYREGLARVPDDPEILFGLASIAASREDHRGAIELYQASLDADVSGAFVSLDPGIRGWKARHNMAVSHVSLGDWPSARELWRKAMNEERRVEAAHAMFASGLEQGDLFACRDVLAWVRDTLGNQKMHWEMARALTNSVGFQLQ